MTQPAMTPPHPVPAHRIFSPRHRPAYNRNHAATDGVLNLPLLATDTCRKLQMHRQAGSKPTTNERKQTTMIEYLKTWLELKTDRRAVTALEYGVIAGVLAVVVVTAFTTLGTGLNNAFTNVSKQL
jgi:pilus assembly protein Flp/PilA